MKIKDIIKKQTTVIAIAVILVVVAAIGVSYAIFFNVNRNTQDQVITAGNLELTVSDFEELTLTEPITEAEALASTSNQITYTVQNTASDLPASYGIYIGGGEGNAISLSSIKISTDGTNSTIVSNLTPTMSEGDITYYQIDSGTLEAGASSTTKNLRIWIDEDLVADEIEGAALNLNLYIVGEVDEG